MKNTELDFLCDTLVHIGEVRENIEVISSRLKQRGEAHDRSKLQDPEFDAFVSTREDFKKANFNTPEYKACSDRIKPALEHHYKKNSHHVKCHKDGVAGMTLLDLLEMLADWKAAARRSPTKSFKQSLPEAFEKYKVEGAIKQIILNTLKELEWEE